MASLAPPPPPIDRRGRPDIILRPFFERKNRAFWILQAAGWSGYLLLRSVSSISNGLPLTAIIPVVIESIVGYCITLLLSALYGYFRTLPRVPFVLLSAVTLGLATMLYSVLDAFSFSFIKLDSPGINLSLVLATLFLNFIVLAGWSALYFGINFYLIVEDQIDQLEKLGTQASSAQLAICVTSSTRISCSTRSTRSRLWCCSNRPSAPT